MKMKMDVSALRDTNGASYFQSAIDHGKRHVIPPSTSPLLEALKMNTDVIRLLGTVGVNLREIMEIVSGHGRHHVMMTM